jgi:predicted molibdopterin-dependent oxidoreductase YjgC
MRNGLVRLTEPMVREDGRLRTATWDEALDRAASGLRAATERNGGRGVGLFSCSKATNEMNFVARSVRRRSGDRVWSRWRDKFIRGDIEHRSHHPLGVERA